MATRIITVITLLALLNGLLGCSSSMLVRPDELKEQPKQKILKVGLTSGDEITFQPPGGMFDAQKQVIWGAIRDSLSHIRAIEIKPDTISYVTVSTIEEETKFEYILGATALAIILVYSISQIEINTGW